MKKCIIIHHNDADGRMGAYILYRYAEKTKKYDSIITIETNYGREIDFTIVSSSDLIYIVDFSLSKKQMEDLLTYVEPYNIVWIDHHISAIKHNNYGCINIAGLRYDGLSGAELAYLYTHNDIRSNDGNMVTIYDDVSHEIYEIDIRQLHVPQGIRYIGDYDCWRHVYPQSRVINAALRYYWDILDLNSEDGRKRWEKLYLTNSTYLKDLLFVGNIILKYDEVTNSKIIKDYAFPTTLHKFPEYKVIAVNATGRNSDLFKILHNDFELGIVFTYKKNDMNRDSQMTFSIYRLGLNPDKEIDCSEIARSYGGGGHKSAAGFVTSGTLPFKRT